MAGFLLIINIFMENKTKKIQIGVIGSCADLQYSRKIEKMAEETGCWVARKDAILIFGAEKDYDSLSSAACRGAKKAGGLTVGVTYGKGLDVIEKNADVIIACGMERGGGRELVLSLSCDAIIVLNGGSGTLTEMAIAYQAGIPIIAFKNTGGWSERLADQFLDDRKRLKIVSCTKPKTAVELALKLSSRRRLHQK